eukprot:118238_1
MAEVQDADKMDTSKNVYVFTHGKRRLFPVIVTLCVSIGFRKEQIMAAKSTKVGNVGDYTATACPPKSQSHGSTESSKNNIRQIKIAQITQIEDKSKPVLGLWAGVTQSDIGLTIPLPINKQNTEENANNPPFLERHAATHDIMKSNKSDAQNRSDNYRRTLSEPGARPSVRHPYNPVRMSSVTYIKHHPKGVKYHDGHFTYSMNSNAQRFAKSDPSVVSHRKASTIPGYKQYVKQHPNYALPFVCWFMLCCGLFIPCCCCCCYARNAVHDKGTECERDMDPSGGTNEAINDTKPLLSKEDNKNREVYTV